MDQVYWIIFASFIMPIFLGAGLTWFFVKYNKKQTQFAMEKKDAMIREQQLLLEKEQALNQERSRIATEMHDELGGGLTAIRYLGHRAQKDPASSKVPDLIDRMVNRSSQLIENMSEIIWAMNSHFDRLESLVSYIRNYARRFCMDIGLEYREEIPDSIEDIDLTGIERRNIFLVVKEVLNNAAKHARAESITLKLMVNPQVLRIHIIDDGVGMSPEQNNLGNGMKNMKDRMNQILGTLNIESDEKGTRVVIVYPLKPPNDDEKN